MKINPIASQAVTHPKPHLHQPPAKAARELLQSRVDLSDQPFGKLVSMIAKGEEIPAAPVAGSSSDTTT